MEHLRQGDAHTSPFLLPLWEGGLSVQAISWVLKHSKSIRGCRLILLSIANYAKDDGTGAWPSLRTLGKEARLSERQVRYCLRRLEKSGELHTGREKGPHGTNLYSFPQMRGGTRLPRGGQSEASTGAICDTRGGNGLPPIRPLSVSKDKEEPRARPRAVSPSLLAKMSEQEWQEHLNKLDPKRKGVSA